MAKRFHVFILALSLISGLTPAAAQAPSGFSTLEGKVVDPQGAVVPRAAVLVVDLRDLSILRSETDAGGTFHFTISGSGDFLLLVKYQCFHFYSKMFSTTGKKLKTLEIGLKADHKTCTSTH